MMYHDEGESLGFAAMCKRLTQLKKGEEHEWLKDPSSVVLQQSLRNQEQAFTNFFEGRAGYPSFKRKHGTQTARHTKAAFSYDADTEDGVPSLKLAKMPGTLKVNWSRELRGEPTAVTISKDPAGRYHVSIEFKAPVQDKPTTGKAVGVDVGLESYITLSTGEKVGNPRFLEDAYRRLRKEQKALSRKEQKALSRKEKNGPNGPSNNWERQKRRVAKAYAKIADRRADFLHKLSTRLAREFDVITVETLAVKNMQRRAASAAPVKNRSLAKAISDAAWGEFTRQLEYKCEWYGKTLVKVDRWFPSTKRCSDCGHVGERKPLHVREWTCTECGCVHDRCVHDRDVNAAKNLSNTVKNLSRVGQARIEAIASKAPGDQRKTSGASRLHGSGR